MLIYIIVLYFIRHGESTSNRDKVFSGSRNDVALTALGRNQAKAAGSEIIANGLDLNRLVCSPLKRAIETASIISEEINFPFDRVIIDDRIAEYDVGSFTGKSSKDVAALEVLADQESEVPESFLKRIKEALAEYDAMDGNTLIVSHGGVSRMMRCYKAGRDINMFLDTPNYKNAKLIVLKWGI
ncbi:MAG: histidine phosphatase family protein [Rhizobiaceae bacterium]|nr:histidine phosphatase family protein [Rhizobiaceae bacterium]